MRGKAAVTLYPFNSIRITPAYAGKSLYLRTTSATMRDHPRICGEKQGSPLQVFANNRITPAYAGKSVPTVETVAARWDHPRICGEKDHSNLPGHG